VFLQRAAQRAVADDGEWDLLTALLEARYCFQHQVDPLLCHQAPHGDHPATTRTAPRQPHQVGRHRLHQHGFRIEVRHRTGALSEERRYRRHGRRTLEHPPRHRPRDS
jgi:hypothetical protein